MSDLRALLLAVSVPLVAGCGSDAASARADGIVALAGDGTKGKALYASSCERCHGADAKSGSAGRDLPSEVRSDKAKAADTVLEGEDEMPSFSGLTDQEIADILAYLGAL